MPYHSKIIEGAVTLCTAHYVIYNDLSQSQQSGYRTGHTAETDLIQIINDVMISADQSNAVVVVPLYMAFVVESLIEVTFFIVWKGCLVC